MYTGIRTVLEENKSIVRKRVRDELNIKDDIPVIVFAGRICEQKRPLLLAEILNITKNSGLPFQALIIGEGEQKDELQVLLNKYQLSHSVNLLGSVPHKEWLDILVASDILLMPSQYEGISIALLEAMAAGVVPIVANVGGQEEIVNKNVGVLIPHSEDEIQQYSEKIQQLISSKARLMTMSNECKLLMMDKLSWKMMVTNFISHIDEAHKLRKNNPRNNIAEGFAKELYIQSMELSRVNVELDWRWSWGPTNSNPNIPSNFISYLISTKIGQVMLKSRILRDTGKKIFKK